MGDIIYFDATEVNIREATNFNLFCYRKHLKTKKVFHAFRPTSITIINKSKNPIYIIKNLIEKRLSDMDNKYLNTFILGESINESLYNQMGISHLFSISGMHISLYALVILFWLKKIFKRTIISYSITILFLLLFSLMISKVSALRAVFMFKAYFLKKTFNLNIDNKYLLLFILSIFLIYNPFLIYSVSFYFSFIVTFFIIISYKNISSKNYFYRLIYISIIAALSSFSITIYYFFEYNVLSIFYNILIVPIVTFFMFPLALISFLFNFSYPFNLVTTIFEKITSYIYDDRFLIIFGRPSVWLIFIYYLILYLYVSYKKMYIFIILLLMIFFFKYSYLFNKYPMLYMFDIGFSESILFVLPKNEKVFLFDTGGHFYNDNFTISNYTIMPFLKSIGISKIDYLVLTHGHIDHMKDALNLVTSFEVSNVYLNSMNNNNLEKELILLLKKNDINYENVHRKDLNVNDYFFRFVSYPFASENENSIITYITFDEYKVLLTGDAYKKQEELVIDEFNIKNIDVLKVAHHGSKTSSSTKFLDTVNPNISLISSSYNNSYNLPNKEVLNRLNNYYITYERGMIVVEFKEKLNIKTFFDSKKGY